MSFLASFVHIVWAKLGQASAVDNHKILQSAYTPESCTRTESSYIYNHNTSIKTNLYNIWGICPALTSVPLLDFFEFLNLKHHPVMEHIRTCHINNNLNLNTTL